MSNVLRSPWVSATIREKLDALGKQGRGVQADTIGPSGELQFPGDKCKPLQVVRFLSFEDPYTAVLSDKVVEINCRFSSEARLRHEISNGRITTMKGGIIKVKSYQICFLGVDGVSFWKGITYGAQVADGLKSRRTSKETKKDGRSSNIGSSKSAVRDRGTENKDISFKALPMPELVLFITDFDFIGSEGSAVFGNPTSLSSKTDIKQLLLDLPRKKCSSEEIRMRFKQTGGSIKTVVHQRGISPSQGNSSRKTSLSKSSRSSRSIYDSDDEIRSQPDVDGGGINPQGVSQLPFATQAPSHYSTTFDDLEFSTQVGPKERMHAKSPLISPLQGSFESAGYLPQMVTTKSQGGKKARPHQARKNAEQSKSLSKSKFINYADGSDFEGSTAGSVTTGGRLNTSELAGNRNKRKRSGLDDPCMPDSASVNVKGDGKAHRGWQGMRRVAKEEAIIPKDQQEILDQPESWYPYEDTRHVSGYDSIPKVQLVPKSHPPRERPTAPVIATPNPPSPVPSSDDGELSWPSSPVRAPVRDINAMPPDSSMPTSSQSQHAGRWEVQVDELRDPRGTQVSSTGGGSYQPDQMSMHRGAKELDGKGSGVQSSPKDSDTGDVFGDMVKRVTRAANGISKKAPVDPNNVEPSRMAKANQKQKFPVARKRRRPESEPEESSEDYESSEDEDIHELINDPNLPVDVVNPNGRTRVAVFGGILKAQQVALWEKERKRVHESGGGIGGDAGSDGGTQGSEDGDTSDKQPESGQENGIGSAVFNAPAREVMEPVVSHSSDANQTKESLPEAKGTGDQSHNEGPVAGNDPMDIVEEPPPQSFIQPTYNSTTVEPLPPKSNQMTPELGKGEALEPTPASSLELPVAGLIDVGTDGGDEIPQEPLIPLNFAAGTKAKVSSILKEHGPFLDLLKGVSAEPTKREAGSQTVIDKEMGKGSKDQEETAPGDSLSTAILLQTSSAPEVSNLSGSQRSVKDITSPSLPSSASNAAPTVQVEETPYRKGLKLRRGETLSPTISKSRTGSGNPEDGFDDIMLIPGTNTEELNNSPASVSLRVAQNLTAGRGDTPDRQAVPLNRVSSSIEPGNPGDDLAMSQRQLRRELQEHRDVEVPATSEVDETRIEDDIRSQPPPVYKLYKPKSRKARSVIKVVDFESREIRAAADANVPRMLEEQKRQFMDSKDIHEFEDMFKGEIPSLRDEHLGQGPEAEIPRKRTSLKVIDVQSSPVPSMTSHSSVRSDDGDMTLDHAQPNIRKRPQSPHPEVFVPTKKPRAGGESRYETGCRPASVAPPCPVVHEEVETSTELRSEPPTKLASMEQPGKDDLELGDDDDPMAGFLVIGSPTDDDFGPSWPPQTPSEPEMYAGIRERHLYVPGYGKLTDEQKKKLDEIRQEYFGIKTSSKRLFSVELQRAMQKASSSSSRRKAKGKEVRGMSGQEEDEWYRDENTPMKLFFRKFKELKQVKTELAIRQRGSEGGGDST